MGTWEKTALIESDPEQVLERLTDPDAVADWSPIDFELEAIDTDRLASGTHATVASRLAGRRVGFEIEVFEAHGNRLSLRASGPVVLDVDYEIDTLDDGADVTARIVTSSGGGLTGRVLSSAADALLAAGMLDRAIAQLKDQLEAGSYALAA
jgi:hypothetical protein